MKFRETLILAVGSFGVAVSFEACSSFGTAPLPGTADSASPASDGGAESSAPPADAETGDGASLTDAAFDCHSVIKDTFDGRAANGGWTLVTSGPNLPAVDYGNMEATFTLPAGSGDYSVLRSKAFFDASASAGEPTDVFIEFDLTIVSLDATGATLAQLPELTDGGNVHVAASSIPASSGDAAIYLLPNGTPASLPKTSITVTIGKKERFQWSYRRNADDLNVTLQRATAGEQPLHVSTTPKAVTKLAYFQMGPYSNLGNVTGVKVAYDNVAVQACTRR